MLFLGLILGLVGAFTLRRAIESQLYGVEPMDPALVAASLGILSVVALVACAFPAHRARRLNPVLALNQE